jgi:hypothetical protein
MPATLAFIVAFASQSSGFFGPVEPLVLLLDRQAGDLSVMGEGENVPPRPDNLAAKATHASGLK